MVPVAGFLIRVMSLQVKEGKFVPLILTEHHAMKAYWGSGGTAPSILDLGTRWRSVISLTTWPLYTQGIADGIHWIVGWVGPRVNLDVVVRRKVPRA